MVCRKRPLGLLPALLLAGGVFGLGSCAAQPAALLPLAAFQPGEQSRGCYDRSVQPQTAAVDAHLHSRPFGGSAIPFEEILGYLERTGVLFATIMGIGQTLPVSSSCIYYLDCPGTPAKPSLKNDFVNAANLVALAPKDLHLTLAMTFPDLENPETILAGMQLLDREFPGLFQWAGEVNLVKQALFGNHHDAVPLAKIGQWAPFMAVLRERGIPISIHSDLGNHSDPTAYLPWMEEVLRLYPDNQIIWVHMGLSKELTAMPADQHIAILQSLLGRYPKLMLDISWRVLEDHVFSDPARQGRYVSFLNAHSERILPGTDFLASGHKSFEVYRAELEATSRILGRLNDDAFRNIALGQNYFRLLNLNFEAPEICSSAGG